MTEFVKIRGSYYQLDHVIAVKKVKPFTGLGDKKIHYVVRISEEAAGGEDPKFRNIWCTKPEVESFLRKMRGLPGIGDEELVEEICHDASV